MTDGRTDRQTDGQTDKVRIIASFSQEENALKIVQCTREIHFRFLTKGTHFFHLFIWWISSSRKRVSLWAHKLIFNSISTTRKKGIEKNSQWQFSCITIIFHCMTNAGIKKNLFGCNSLKQVFMFISLPFTMIANCCIFFLISSKTKTLSDMCEV